MNSTNNQFQSFFNNSIGLHKLKKDGLGANKIVLFPHAGTSSLAYHAFARELSNINSIYAINPPGHIFTEGQQAESIQGLVQQYLEALPLDIFDDAFLFGHSLGGYVAYEMACQLQSYDISIKGLIISCSLPPHLPKVLKSNMDIQQLFNLLQQEPQAVKSNMEVSKFSDNAIQVLRNDISLYERYLPAKKLLLSNLPVLIIGAVRDKICPFYLMYGWHKWIIQLKLAFLEGDHFYINKNLASLGKLITNFTMAK